jgi:uncharacterized membrane protein
LRASSNASLSDDASTTEANRRISTARSCGVTARQAGKAAFARATARSASWTLASGMSAITCSVAGSMTFTLATILTPESKLVLSLRTDDREMQRSRVILMGSVAAAALLAGGVIGATAASSPSPTPSPTAAPHSNENATHESGESAAQEQAENNGTFHPGGPGGPGGPGPNGQSNESAAHEATESPSREASEKS